MSDIADYHGRITAALDRIGRGIDAIVEPDRKAGDQGSDTVALREALEAERSTNAQLTERVRAIKDKQETTVATLEAKVARLGADLDRAGQEVQRQKRLAGELADTNRALREAVEKGLSDPGLVDAALRTELAALQADRAADIAEMAAILSELTPLVDGADASGEKADA